MSKKRPFSSEGHLHLPTALGPDPAGDTGGDGTLLAGTALSPLRPGPFVSARRGVAGAGVATDRPPEDRPPEDRPPEDSATLRIQDDTYADLGLRAGDKLVLRRGRTPEHGDMVLVAQDAGCAGIWKAYPERERLLLRRGIEERSLRPDTPIVGVVIAVKRPLRA